MAKNYSNQNNASSGKKPGKTWDPDAEMKRRREEAQAKKKKTGQFSSAAQRTQKSLGGSLEQRGSSVSGKGSSSNSGTLYGNSSKITNNAKITSSANYADQQNRKKIANTNKLKQLTNGAYEDAFGRKNKRLDRVR